MRRSAAQTAGGNELAQLLAELILDHQAFPGRAAEDLSRLLAQELGNASAAAQRQARLGLLIELVSQGGDYVTASDYQAARAARAKRGEKWPDASTLSRAIGHWILAVQAATRFWFDGGPARVRASAHTSGGPVGYQPQEIVAALALFHREHGVWPTSWEWERYVAIRRRFDRRRGRKRRWPGSQQLRKAYGSFADAVSAAERANRSAKA